MSWQLRLLNVYLRHVEKPRLARLPPERLRRTFARQARLLFHAPRGTQYERGALDGVPVQWVRPRRMPADRPRILYLHGGAFVFGSSDTHRAMLGRLAAECGLVACLPDYRLAPEHPFPAAADDVLAAYRALRAQGDVVIGGDSAGGGLAFGLWHDIQVHGLPRPRGFFAFSPVVDLSFSGASIAGNAEADVLLSPERIDALLAFYLHGRAGDGPRASPLGADFEGVPPVWLTVGDTEILRDDTLRLATRLRACGGDVTLSVKHDHPHVWPLFHTYLPEAKATLQDLAAWIGRL